MSFLVEWVAARELIRKNKEQGIVVSPFGNPWTVDPIFGVYRFCNVRRRHDRVSCWLQENVYNLEALPDQQLMFATFCRWNNWPPAIAAVLKEKLYPSESIDWGAVREVLSRLEGKAWTGAYMIRGSPRGVSKAEFVIDYVINGSVKAALSELMKTLKTRQRRPVWQRFSEVLYFGSFMAGQVVDDLTWTPLLANPEDEYTWAPQGPGSLRGFNRMLGLPLGTKHPETEWCSQLCKWREEIIGSLGSEYEDLTLHDMQNVCCEADKYLRVKNGEGRPRAKYQPERAY